MNLRKNLLSCLIALLAIGAFQKILLAQDAPAAIPPRGQVVEVSYYKGRNLAYQRIGEWAWYELFQRPASWKPSAEERPVAAVKITPRAENGSIKVRVTVLKGKNLEIEDFVADYPLAAGAKSTVNELSRFGVEPFELTLVRAPTTVAPLPSLVNKTKSLQVTFEPSQSSLPTFTARVLNMSQKPVAAYSYYTSIGVQKKLSGMPQSKEGGALIVPGTFYLQNVRYPLNLSPVSTGEVPSALPDLVFNVTAVIFADGSFEGEPYSAARYLAVNYGEKMQIRRFIVLLKGKEFSGSASEINASIPASVDEAEFNDLIQRFPVLTDGERSELRSGMEFGKSEAVNSFRSLFASKSFPLTEDSTKSLIEALDKRFNSLP